MVAREHGTQGFIVLSLENKGEGRDESWPSRQIKKEMHTYLERAQWQVVGNIDKGILQLTRHLVESQKTQHSKRVH